jgi:hypothetical protein
MDVTSAVIRNLQTGAFQRYGHIEVMRKERLRRNVLHWPTHTGLRYGRWTLGEHGCGN